MIEGETCCVLDIGANSGSYTLMFAEAVGAGSSILAFEANPAMAERLRQNIDRNDLGDFVTIHNIALSNGPGTATFSLRMGNLGQSTLELTSRRGYHQIEVKTAPLIDYLPDRHAFQHVVLKIDIEGHEDKVLGPFLDIARDDQLPDIVLIETAHKDQWALDLTAVFDEKGYEVVFEGEGNTLYKRPRN